MDYFYHYTTLKNWEKIQKEGLKPYQAIDSFNREGLPTLAHKPTIFGLTSSAPESWLRYPSPSVLGYPIPILHNLLNYISGWKNKNNPNDWCGDLVLLKIQVLPEDDVRIGDLDQIRRQGAIANDPAAYQTALINYCKSVTKLRGKFNVAAAKTLPEVLCFNAIPANRIELVEKIPGKTVEEIQSYIAQKIKSQNVPNPVTPSPPASGATRPKRSVP